MFENKIKNIYKPMMWFLKLIIIRVPKIQHRSEQELEENLNH